MTAVEQIADAIRRLTPEERTAFCLWCDLIGYTRLVVRSVQGCMSVTDAQRMALGITIRANPTHIPRPKAAPRLKVSSVVGRTLSVKLRDAESPQLGKPRRIAGANVFSFVGDTPPLSVNDWMLHASVTRTRLDVRFPATVPPSAKVWLTTRWFNPRSQAGPMSDPVSIVFGGGSGVAANGGLSSHDLLQRHHSSTTLSYHGTAANLHILAQALPFS